MKLRILTVISAQTPEKREIRVRRKGRKAMTSWKGEYSQYMQSQKAYMTRLENHLDNVIRLGRGVLEDSERLVTYVDWVDPLLPAAR